MSITQEAPPESVDIELREYLTRRFVEIGTEMDRAPKFPERKQMPYKPQIGDVQYFGNPDNHDYDPIINLQGWWGFVGTDTGGVWVNTSSPGLGYGGIEQFDDVALADINATPQVMPANVGAVPFPQNLIQDTANNGVIVEASGVWNITLSASLTFTGTNTGRQYAIEFYNATEDVVTVAPIVSVGRNAEGSTPAASLLFDIADANIGDLYQFRLISTTDTFTGVDLNFFSFNMIRIDTSRDA